jgi:hypothetical protein
MTTLPADELRSLAAGARKAAEHYREHPDEIARNPGNACGGTLAPRLAVDAGDRVTA